MTRLAILTHPDPRLRTTARPVTIFDAALRRLVHDLIETLRVAGGIGLAATQVGVHQCVIAVDVAGIRRADRTALWVPMPPPADTTPPDGRTVRPAKPVRADHFGPTAAKLWIGVNPRILTRAGRRMSREGCLSVPDTHVDVVRASAVTVVAEDLDGRPHAGYATGLLAACLQHEVDHLRGHLIIDDPEDLPAPVSPRPLATSAAPDDTSRTVEPWAL